MNFVFLAGTFAIATVLLAKDPIPSASRPRESALSPALLRTRVEEDWLRQAEAMELRAIPGNAAQKDARGACDGVKDGKYGFHTALEANPWWQVDLGKVQPLSKIKIFNRLDYGPGLHNADNLNVLASEDGRQWTIIHQNKNSHFGGISGAPPLEIDLPKQCTARYVRLQIPSEKPIFFHLDEVEVFGPADSRKNLALHRPADQSSISQWSTSKPLAPGEGARTFPTAEFLASARKLALDLQKSPAGLQELDSLERRLQQLPKDASESERRDLYFQARRAIRLLAFSNPLLDWNELLFVKRFTQETYPDVCLNHMPWVSRPGGDLCVLRKSPNGQNIELQQILNGALGPGHVHGMDLSWDAQRIVFGFARAKNDQPPKGWLDRTKSYELRRTEEPIHIFEVRVDGKGLRQITSGEWSDLDPTYAPNGDIVFVSERCGTSLQCNEYDKDETSCNLYVMRADGSGIRRLSANKDGDYLPHTLDDGTIAYTRWEYHERSFAFIQSIWTIRPDGTSADAIFKQHFANPWALEDTRSIPRSKKLVSIAAGHHTLATGPLVIVDPSLGINDTNGIQIITPGVQPPEGGMSGKAVAGGGLRDNGGFYSTPWAISEKYFLVSYSYSDKQTEPAGYGLYLVDIFGNKELLYRDPEISSFMPIPLRPRSRPPILPPQHDLAESDATCLVTDASFGTDGVSAGDVKYIRISEPVGWPYDNQLGGSRYGEDHRYGGAGGDKKNLLSWTPIRVLGDVPVESDGSAHFKVPADRAVYFQLLDARRQELRRMRSFISFQPGEVRACVGCHESRGISPPAPRTSLAAARPPVRPIPPPWGDRPLNFLRDVQPVLDRNCANCHGGLKPAAGLDFSAGLLSHDKDVAGYGFNRAYQTILDKQLVSMSAVRAQDASITPALAYGSHKSKLIQALGSRPHDTEARLSEEDRLRLVIWIDANAPYHDGFVNKRAEHAAYDLAADDRLRERIAEVHERRCASCHKTQDISRLDWIDVRDARGSLFLKAPLARQWGGSERCRSAVYENTSDVDYQLLRRLVSAAVEKAKKFPRRDLETAFREKEMRFQTSPNGR